MQDSLECPTCGTALTDGRCPQCTSPWLARLVHREIIIVVLLCGIAVAAFFGTREVARRSRTARLEDAAYWYALGQRDLDDGRPADAVAALRRATNTDTTRQQYRLALARALGASNQDDAARRVLLALRRSSPEDPEINLQLARLEARGTDLDATRAYYQSALYGHWPAEDAEARRNVRVELVRYLLAHGEKRTALAELLALVPHLPDEPARQVEAGQLFLAADDPSGALDRFTRALALEPKNGTALAGAGRAAFDLGDYARARRFLRAAPDELPYVVELRTVAEFILTRDPLAARLSTAERRRRLTAAFEQARSRLGTCVAGQTADSAAAASLGALAVEAETFEPALEPAAFRRSSDVVETGVDLVARIEETASRWCGAPTGLDRALLLIGRLHSTESQ